MRSKAAALLSAAAILLTGCGNLRQEDAVTIRLMNFGYEDSRYTCLEEAVSRYNMANPNHPLTLEVERYTDAEWDWNDYQALFEQATEDGSVDLILASSDFLGSLAEQGYLEPMDDIVESEPFQSEYLSPLLPSLTYDGHYWGLLVETSVRMVYWNVDVLRSLGLAESDLQAFPGRVRCGEITMQDLLGIAQAGLDSGLTQYGVVHRPTPGLFFYLMAEKFGACYLEPDGQILYDRDNLIQMLRYFQELSQQNNFRLPTSWKTCNEIFYQGNAAVYFGGCWTPHDVMLQNDLESSEALEQQYIPTVFPAVDVNDTPSTISNSMIIMLAKNSGNKEVIKNLLADAYSDWNALGSHAAQTFHMPVSRSAAACTEMEENTFLRNNLYMLDLTDFMPNRSDTEVWFQALFNAVRSIENGTGTLDEVADMLIHEIEQMQVP